MKIFTGAFEFDGQSDKADLPNSKLPFLFSALLRRWESSLVRTMARELYRIPRRIRAIREMRDVKYSPTIPLKLWDHSPASFRLENSFLLACSRDIEQLTKKHHWSGPLEAQMAAQAFQLGARWGTRNFDNEIRNEA
jgi:hypothetical protein